MKKQMVLIDNRTVYATPMVNNTMVLPPQWMPDTIESLRYDVHVESWDTGGRINADVNSATTRAQAGSIRGGAKTVIVDAQEGGPLYFGADIIQAGNWFGLSVETTGDNIFAVVNLTIEGPQPPDATSRAWTVLFPTSQLPIERQGTETATFAAADCPVWDVASPPVSPTSPGVSGIIDTIGSGIVLTRRGGGAPIAQFHFARSTGVTPLSFGRLAVRLDPNFNIPDPNQGLSVTVQLQGSNATTEQLLAPDSAAFIWETIGCPVVVPIGQPAFTGPEQDMIGTTFRSVWQNLSRFRYFRVFAEQPQCTPERLINPGGNGLFVSLEWLAPNTIATPEAVGPTPPDID